MANTEFIGGKLTLKVQQDTLNTFELNNLAKVTAYTKKEPQPASGQVNMPTLEDVPIGDQPPLWQLIPVGAGRTAESVAPAQTPAAKTLPFQTIAYAVSNKT